MQRNDSRRSNGIARTPSRRRVLSLGTAGIVSALGGCSSITGQSTSTPGQWDSDVFETTTFDGRNLVVNLHEEHEANRLNIISPDGSKFADRELSTGVTTTEIPVLDIEWGLAGYEHYEPGDYELVAVGNGDSVDSITIELEPRIEIEAVSAREHRDSELLDTLELKIVNRGTGPTWIYDIAYPELEKGEESTTGDNPGVPQSYLASPENASGVIVPPGESQRFVGRDTPFRFGSKSVCSGEMVKGRVIAATPIAEESSREFTVEFAGPANGSGVSAGSDEYYCTEGKANITTPSGDES